MGCSRSLNHAPSSTASPTGRTRSRPTASLIYQHELPTCHPAAGEARVAVDRLLRPRRELVGIRRQCRGTARRDPTAPNSDYAVSKVAAANLLHFYGKRKRFPLREPAALFRLRAAGGLVSADPDLIRHGLGGRLPRVCQPRSLARFRLRRRRDRGVRRHGAEPKPGRLRRIVQHRHRPKDDHRRGRRDRPRACSISRPSRPSPCPTATGTFRTGTPTSRRPENAWAGSRARASRRPRQHGGLVSLPCRTSERTTSRPRNSASIPSTASAQWSPVTRTIKRFRSCTSVSSRRLRKLNIDFEIIFVNDCSPDDTEEVIRASRATTGVSRHQPLAELWLAVGVPQRHGDRLEECLRPARRRPAGPAGADRAVRRHFGARATMSFTAGASSARPLFMQFAYKAFLPRVRLLLVCPYPA